VSLATASKAKQHSSYGQAHLGPQPSMPTRPFRTNPARRRKIHPLSPTAAAAPAPPRRTGDHHAGPAVLAASRAFALHQPRQQGRRHVGPHAPSPPQSVKPQAAHASPSLRPALRAPDQNPNQPTTADDELAARRSRDELPRCALWRGGRGPNSSDRVSSSPRRHRCRVPASRF
jgi:hypothetical protein